MTQKTESKKVTESFYIVTFGVPNQQGDVILKEAVTPKVLDKLRQDKTIVGCHVDDIGLLIEKTRDI